MKSLKTMNILCFIKKTKLLKNGEAPIFIRITINGEISEFGIKKSTPIELWDSKKERIKGDSKKAEEVNDHISKLKRQISVFVDFYALENQPITSRLIVDKINGKKEERKTILKIFAEHNENAKKLTGIDFAPGTIQRYETSYMHTKDFIKWKFKREDIALVEINQQFVKDYELYLKTVRNCNHNSATKYLKNFKKIIRIALANRWMGNDPFASVKFKLKPVDSVYLNRHELDLLMNKKISIERIDQIRDIFLFCCFTGLAFSDVKSLKEEHLSTDNDGFLWIHKRRQKTNQMSTIFVIDATRRIIEKYKEHPANQTKGSILPVLSNQKMNAYLKEIADICGINKAISTHSARHTFATTVALENNMPLEVVSKALGHSNIKMTQRYARTTEELIKNNMQKIMQIY